MFLQVCLASFINGTENKTVVLLQDKCNDNSLFQGVTALVHGGAVFHHCQ